MNADPNFKSKDGTPLVLAAHNGHIAVGELLIGAGAEVDCRSADGDTPLHRVCAKQGCTTEMIGKLLERGADISKEWT